MTLILNENKRVHQTIYQSSPGLGTKIIHVKFHGNQVLSCWDMWLWTLMCIYSVHWKAQLTKEVSSVLCPVDWPCSAWAAAYPGWRSGQISPGWTQLLLEAPPWLRWTAMSSAAGIPWEVKRKKEKRRTKIKCGLEAHIIHCVNLH